MCRTSGLTREESIEKWKKIIDECESSGLSQKEWCKEHHINLSTYGHWKATIKEQGCEGCVLDRITREHYIKIARELCYPVKVRDDIKMAKSKTECEQILRSARKGAYDK